MEKFFVFAVIITAVTTEPAKPQKKCIKDGDVGFVLDVGPGVEQKNVEDMMTTMLDSVSYLPVNSDNAQVSLASFGGDKPKIHMQFKTTASNQKTQRILSSLSLKAQEGGSRFTGFALGKIGSMMFRAEAGDRVDRMDYLIVFLTGESRAVPLLLRKSKELKDKGITVLAVGVGPSVPQEQLAAVASSPNLIFTYNSFTELKDSFPLFFKKMVVHCNCMNKADIMFMLDTSTGLDKDQFKQMKSAVKTIVSWVDVDQESARIALASFGKHPRLAFNLKRATDNKMAMKKIDKFNKMIGGQRKMFKIMRFMNKKVFKASNGARDDVDQYVIIFLTGPSIRSHKFMKQAKKFVKEGKKVMVVAIGNVPEEQLTALVSGPNMVFIAKDFDEIPSAVENIKTAALNCGE